MNFNPCNVTAAYFIRFEQQAMCNAMLHGWFEILDKPSLRDWKLIFF